MKTVNKFTISGVLFGLLFPILSTLFESLNKFGTISFSLLLQVQTNTALLWVINTAPLFLGLFARLAGIKQERAEKINRELKFEIISRNAIETNLREMISIYKEDLEAAKIIQEFSLPKISKFLQCKIAYKYIPLNPVGGDFLSLQKINENTLSILVGDVVGHGISAALITSLVNVLANNNKHVNSPSKYLESLNFEANKYLPDDSYFTAIYGLFEFQKDSVKLLFSRGGHPYPFIYSSKENKTTLAEIPGSPLGLMDELSFLELTISLQPKDRVYFITDGILEARNINNKILGPKGLCDLFTKASTQNHSIEESIQYIIKEFNAYCFGVPVNDDCLILGIEILE